MAKYAEQLAVREADLNTYARIRNAALQGFARDGIAETSIRDVAAAAGVSPGLVQHHFTTKAGLREAVNDYVISLAVEALGDMTKAEPSLEALSEMGDRVTAFIRDNVTAMRYVARALADGDEGAGEVFAVLTRIARSTWEHLRDEGAVRHEVDLDWAALHVVIFNFGTLLMETAISEQLGGPFFSPTQLERWNVATTDLYRRGLYRPADEKGKRRTTKRKASASKPH